MVHVPVALAANARTESTAGGPPPIAEADDGAPAKAAVAHPGESSTAHPGESSTAHPGEKVPFDQLAQLDYDKSIFFLGVVPLVVVGGILIVYVVLYFYRRGKQWNELGEAMRLDDEPDSASMQTGFTTTELQNLDPTRPSERLRKVDDGQP